jgi:peroxiredoxin
MPLTFAPLCKFGEKAVDFRLPGTDGRTWSLQDCAGPNGLLVMFICNHCPYVKAINHKLVRDAKDLRALGVYSVAIMSNDDQCYAEDSWENMHKVAEAMAYPFPYLYDETQEVARAFGAVCTPDFFGYNRELELQYRGRLDASGAKKDAGDVPRELYLAMKQVAETGKGPEQQFASMGCSIKWRTSNSWQRRVRKWLLRWDRLLTPWVLMRRRAWSVMAARWKQRTNRPA